MKRRPFLAFVPPAVALAAAPVLVRAQGEFVNFEAPQVVPISVAVIGEASYVLACNTPDCTVEIYDGASQQLVDRVPVGLSPVTVRWNPDNQAFYACNYIGDSVSVVTLTSAGIGTLQRTVHVGNGPTDIAFRPESSEAVVALHDERSVVIIDETTLQPIACPPGNPDCYRPPLMSNEQTVGGEQWALKFPRQVEFLEDGRMYVLNTLGGNRPSHYDVDLFVDDATSLAIPNKHLSGGMGSTNTAFAVDADNERMFVVGGKALNVGTTGEAAVAAKEFGFVESFLWVVDVTAGVPPTAIAEQALSGTAAWKTINLNRDYTTDDPVAASQRVALPTDVLLVPDENGDVEYVVIASFGTDRVLVLEQDGTANGGWARTAIDVDPLTSGNDYGATGPRGLAYDDVTGKVWVMCRLDNSLAVFTPGGSTIDSRIPLSHDPTPETVYAGRRFLYAARQTSGGHMVACASCHVDGRTDTLRWDLGIIGGTEFPEMPKELIDADIATYPGASALANLLNDPPKFHPEKGVLITQTFQGLVNSQLAPRELQYVTTNAPYHWRGDRASFQDFNGAFVGLQGMTALSNGGGITDGEMDEYTDFVNSIHYPPNPEQPLDRRQTGSLGDVHDIQSGSGSLLGMKIFHIAPSMSGQNSCVHCHALPEGSSNTFFLKKLNGKLPQENAQIRGLFQRERGLVTDFDPTDPDDWVRIADRGLMRDGEGSPAVHEERTINDFNNSFALGSEEGVRAMNRFVRWFDWGVGPLVGRAMTVDTSTPVDSALLAVMEEAVFEANSGLVVRGRVMDGEGFLTQSFWYDVSVTPAVYRKIGGESTTRTQAQLLAAIDSAGERLVFQAVPCGSERRIGHANGQPSALTGADPSNVELLRMVPSTAYVEVGQLVDHTDPAESQPELFQTLKKMRVLEAAAAGLGFGVYEGGTGDDDDDRHEPPRRLRVAGDDIRHGAKLRIGMVQGDPDGVFAIVDVEFDLAATGYRHEGMPVWETTEELDPLMQMVFLNGGPENDHVRALLDSFDEMTRDAAAGNLDAEDDNVFEVEVANQSGNPVRVFDQQMRIHDERDPANQPALP